MPSKNKSSSRKQHEEDEGLWGGHGVASAPEASEVAQGYEEKQKRMPSRNNSSCNKQQEMVKDENKGDVGWAWRLGQHVT